MEWTAAAIAEACGRPRGIRGVLITGAKGGFGDAQGSSRGLSGPADLKWLLSQRSLADRLVVSYGTAIREGYPALWRSSGEYAELRELLQLPAALEVVVVSDDAQRRAAARSSGFTALAFETLVAEVTLHDGAAWSCEGGPVLIDRLAATGLLSELAWTTSPELAVDSTAVPELDEWRRRAHRSFHYELDGFTFDLSVSG